MKKDNVPQDDANMFEGKTRELQYALDENGNYVAVKSVGWDAKNTVMQQAWDDVNEKINEARQAVVNGEKSPLYYHMVRNMMDVSLLAQYSGIWSFKVRQHLKPKTFNKLKEKTLNKYLSVFNFSSKEELLNINERGKD